MHLQGCITALATPFAADGSVDHAAWARSLANQLVAGVSAIVVAGSTGEASALYPDEYDALLRAAVAAVGDRIGVLAGTGLANTAKTIELNRHVQTLGAQAALIVTPPYVRPTQEGLFRHYLTIAEQGDLPIVLYNVPSRTGCDLLPETVARLCTHPRILGIKEARNEPERMQALLALRSPSFAVLSGDDPTCTRALLAGADGVVSVASNVVPKAFAWLCAQARAGNRDAVASLDAQLAALYRFLGAEPNPIPVKALLAAQGIGHGLRLPLTELTAENRAQLPAMLALCAQVEAGVPTHGRCAAERCS